MDAPIVKQGVFVPISPTLHPAQLKEMQQTKATITLDLTPQGYRRGPLRTKRILKVLEGFECLVYDIPTQRFCRALIERKRKEFGWPLTFVGRTSLVGADVATTSILPDSHGSDYGLYIIYNSPNGSGLKEGVFNISDERLLFMRKREHGERIASYWPWNLIPPVSGLERHPYMMHYNPPEMPPLEFTLDVYKDQAKAEAILARGDPWIFVPPSYSPSEATLVGGRDGVDEVNFESSSFGIPCQARDSLQDNEYMFDGRDYGALKLADEEMVKLERIIPVVGRGNHATDFGVSFQQHLGREIELTFDAFKAKVRVMLCS